MKKYVLITGAAGLLGSRLCEWILYNKPDYHVIAVDDLSGGYKENLAFAANNPRLRFFNRDVSNSSLEDIFSEYSPEFVFHLAAYAAECVSPFIRKFNYQNNLVATANIINFCIKYTIKRLIFTSSMAVYGHAVPPFSEDLIPQPTDPYGIAKYACEQDIRIAGEQHGLDWCILRPHNVYGRNQNIWDSYRNVLGIWMWKHLNGFKLSIYGDGSQTRAFSCINDVLEPMWKAATDTKASKQIINVGGIENISIKEAAFTLIDVMGGGVIEYLEPRNEVKHAWSTWDKSVDLLGFQHKTSLYDGLLDMWNWAKQQPNRPRFIWSNYELDVGLYSYWKPESLKNPTPIDEK